eukprot:TRINITY_DN8022_c0_g1_i1.p1 TRINITY_DN8022_c0_g1~~TRINITY_DN8022_c0_g1_i1.p1  ORF type:complete len:204 (-),score=67.51 TRINITY_DN8022_c0_g1_i1:39-572(-)
MAPAVRFLVSLALLTTRVTAVAGDHQEVSSEDGLDSEGMRIFQENFEANDIDKDGELDREEAVAIARKQNPDKSDDDYFLENVNSDFNASDHDESGTLSMGEFLELLSSAEEYVGEDEYGEESDVKDDDDGDKDDPVAEDEDDDGDQDADDEEVDEVEYEGEQDTEADEIEDEDDIE